MHRSRSFEAKDGRVASQAGRYGEASIGLKFPFELFVDENGEALDRLDVAPSDLLALVVGLAAASLDIAAGHQNYTFNNMLACLICCDILQAWHKPLANTRQTTSS